MEISEIRARLPLAKVLSHYGWTPDGRGRMRCPFHDDKTPSLQTYPDTGTVYCFAGGCPTHGKSLDVIDIIKQADGCTKHEAIVRAKAMAGGLPADAIRSADAIASAGGTKPAASANRVVADEAARRAVLQRIWSYYATAFANAPAAREYASVRGLAPAGLATAGAPVGYNSGQLHHGARRDEALIASCVRFGLMSDSGQRARTGALAYKTFGKGCLAFALRERGGELGGFYYRATGDSGAKHLYLAGRRGLYPRWPPPTTRRLLVTESVIDAASVVQSPETLGAEWSVLALYGTNGWTPEHTASIDAIDGLEEVCLMLDADTAGRRATVLYAGKARERWPTARVTSVELPEGADVNGVLVEAGAEALAKAIAGRQELGAGIFSSTEAAASEMKEPGPAPDVAVAGVPVAAEARSEKARSTDERGRLDESDPYDLGYRGAGGRYRVKGLRAGQLDALKVTVRITRPPISDDTNTHRP